MQGVFYWYARVRWLQARAVVLLTGVAFEVASCFLELIE
jgi:hypothetical protein